MKDTIEIPVGDEQESDQESDLEARGKKAIASIKNLSRWPIIAMMITASIGTGLVFIGGNFIAGFWALIVVLNGATILTLMASLKRKNELLKEGIGLLTRSAVKLEEFKQLIENKANED